MTERETINIFNGFKFLPREQKAVEIAVEALEKQIPKEIRQEIEGGRFERYCPNNCQITGVTMYANIKYCPYCGQKLKWE